MYEETFRTQTTTARSLGDMCFAVATSQLLRIYSNYLYENNKKYRNEEESRPKDTDAEDYVAEG